MNDPVATPTHQHLFPKRLGSVAGLVAAASGLAAGELLSGLFNSLASPIIGVGNRIVDLVPVPVKDFAISTFGTHDKQALLIGIGVTIALASILLGAIATRYLWIGTVGVGLFGIVGAIAGTTGRTGTASDALPSLLAGVVGASVITLLLHSTTSHDRVSNSAGRRVNVSSTAGRTDEQVVRAVMGRECLQDGNNGDQPLVGNTDGPVHSLGRRQFLALAGGFAVAAGVAGTVGRKLQSSSAEVAKRAKLLLPAARKPLAAIPIGVAVPELAAVTPFITSNRDFYRIDTALVVPKVDIDSWKLTIDGMVENKRTYSYKDILNRDLVERDITLTCVSNEVGGILMGNARWLGIPLKELLDDAGAKSGATQIVGHSVDGWTSGFPTAVLDQGKEAFLAIGMNGEALPFAHGFPARLVVPGLYGYVSATKWLTRIEMTTLEAVDAYWVPRGYAKEAPVKLASRIDVPRGLSTVPAGPTAIAGIAWAQTTGVAKVEVKIDAGEWQEAELADEQSINTWRQWKLRWDATPGQHEITVRATDTKGKLQIEQRTAPLPNGATGWHQTVVFVS